MLVKAVTQVDELLPSTDIVYTEDDQWMPLETCPARVVDIYHVLKAFVGLGKSNNPGV